MFVNLCILFKYICDCTVCEVAYVRQTESQRQIIANRTILLRPKLHFSYTQCFVCPPPVTDRYAVAEMISPVADCPV